MDPCPECVLLKREYAHVIAEHIRPYRVSYPAYHHAYLIEAFLNYFNYCGSREALRHARELADWNDYARRARDLGIEYIGACCGITASHIRAMAEALGRTTAASDKSPDLDIHPILGPEKAGMAGR